MEPIALRRMSRRCRAAGRLCLLSTVILILSSIQYQHPATQAVYGRHNAHQPVIVAYYGQRDAEIIAALPKLDLHLLLRPHQPQQVPLIHYRAIPPGRSSADAAAAPELAQALRAPDLPDTLLLFSAGWFGDRLRQAAGRLGLGLNDEQFKALESMAATQSVNTRLLLTIAAVQDAPRRYPTQQDWIRWLYLETSRIRAALGPFAAQDVQMIVFRDGRSAAMRPGKSNPALWALTTIFGPGRTLAETQRALDRFLRIYADHFGDPVVDEARAAVTTPFLYKPYAVELTGRGYYDHTYPSVDYGGDPNSAGMLDYLGRTTTSYDTHDGDDFWMPYGSDVLAPVSGSIIWRYLDDPDNKALIIGYDNNAYEIYIGHLSEVITTTTSVTRGQVIGKSGAPYSGGLPHIHFEVRHNGRQTDTLGWYGGGADPCPSGPGPVQGGYRGCEASIWLWADEQPPECSDAAEVGAWSSRQQAFIDAYERNGGKASLGCTTTGAEWWGSGESAIVRQNFTGSDGLDNDNDAVITHDEQRDDPVGSTPAYVLRDQILSAYTSLGGPSSWLGPLTSDPFTNTTGLLQSNFRSGYITWDGNAAQAYAWPAENGQWRAEFHNGLNLNNYPTWVQNQSAINCSWGASAPGGGGWGIWADTFSARYSGRFFFAGGDYTFIARASDGIRVLVDGALIIDGWQDQPVTEYQANLALTPGEHDIVVEYYENSGDAAVWVYWTRSPTGSHRVFLPLVERGAAVDPEC